MIYWSQKCKKGKHNIINVHQKVGYESLHIMELLSVQCLQVDDVIPISLLITNGCKITKLLYTKPAHL